MPLRTPEAGSRASPGGSPDGALQVRGGEPPVAVKVNEYVEHATVAEGTHTSAEGNVEGDVMVSPSCEIAVMRKATNKKASDRKRGFMAACFGRPESCSVAVALLGDRQP